ncbi:MAG TPA: valine--tRNA ligase [Rudaea sp.]|jgi:valyl-tRNA synthetase|uniref:valine--tRNA ligase n=1 Tax=Rudaea sp. TaxID=2136325 RepID=UPI002F926DA3
MEKSYEPALIESKWYAAWEAAGDFKPAGNGEPYCILLPPPNVTGTLHMGHAFQMTIMDALSRYHRMRGFRTLWQGGADHAGIATQKIVENQLAAQGKTRHDLGREKFIERVWEWKAESGSTITHQMRRLGASVDWSRERFTMDEGLSAAVRRVFVQWYRDGLLYRGRRLVNWDPLLMTAVSDLEVNSEEKDGSLWSIRYNVIDPQPGEPDHVVVATTRPETMLGDVAVAVHPDDERYQALIGKTVTLPLSNREIPVIADDYVDREFGTGAVKITPAHDFNDWQIGARHKLTPINIFTLDGKILGGEGDAKTHAQSGLSKTDIQAFEAGIEAANALNAIPEEYRGLDRFVARKRIVAKLEEQGLLVETKKHKRQVPISQRSDAIIEPMLTDQWFLDLTSNTRVDGKPGLGGRKAITEPALNAVRDGAIKFVPDNWSTTYTQWLDNIQDWCVSRQLWWGHRIPAWYDEAGNIFVGQDEADARAHATAPLVGALRQDDDVLDTWFSSALWPFSTLGWPANGPVKENGKIVADWKQDQVFLPSAVLVTGFDIIFFWVARMVMATQYFTGRVPFREVYINAIVRDAEGQKMSKSKGNTIDPLDLIDGIELDALVKKSTSALLIPQVREKVEKRIRKDYPEGIAAVGTDALRFTFAALATYGRTINFDLKRAEGYRHFCNKLWNAARFVLTWQAEVPSPEHAKARGDLIEPSAVLDRPTSWPATPEEQWIIGRLRNTLTRIDEHFANYRFDLLAQVIYEFVWNEYCDWFLELAKPYVNPKVAADLSGETGSSTNIEKLISVRYTLVHVLEATLRALHPITPFITEEIWQSVAPLLGLKETSIAQRMWPRADELPADDTAASAAIEWLRAVLSQIRRMRSENNIAPSVSIEVIFDDGAPNDIALVHKFDEAIRSLAKANAIRFLYVGEAPPRFCALVTLGELAIRIPLDGLVDRQAEIARLDKEFKRLESEVLRAETKLANANFTANAPPAVVYQERERINRFSIELTRIKLELQKLRNEPPP